MMPGPGDDGYEDDGPDTEENQDQGNGDSEDDNGRDDRNDGCQDQPGMKGTTGTRSKQRETQMTRPWRRQVAARSGARDDDDDDDELITMGGVTMMTSRDRTMG
jgi:hypothetical protein